MFDLSSATVLIIAAAALATGILHGATGMAGGVAMAAILAHIIGIRLAVPVMTLALIFSHASRVGLYWRDTDRAIAGRVLLFGCPMIAAGAYIFTRLHPEVIAAVFAVFLMVSIPLKRWARTHQFNTGPRLLAAASSVWGILAGNVIGPGFFLAPFLQGTGMNRLTFVGTLATITLVMNLLKSAVFGSADLMSSQVLIMGVGIGLITVPGNWLGRSLLRGMSDNQHRLIIDGLTLLMIANFAYLAINPT